jgi:hypothetical protein
MAHSNTVEPAHNGNQAPPEPGYFLLSAAASGLLLQLCLPIGALWGITQPPFLIVWGLHLLCLLYAAGCALSLIGRLWLVSSRGRFLSALLTLTALLGITLLALLPISARDALIHHLAVPQWWLERDQIYAIPWHDWSYYPMLVNLGFTGLLALGLERLTPFYHLLYLLLLCGAVARSACLLGANAASAVFAALLTFTLPLCLKLASSPLVDLGLAAYFALAFLAALQSSKAEPRLTIYHLYSGIFFGLALSCKYNALLGMLLAAPALLLLFSSQANPRGLLQALRSTTFICLLALLVFSPWLIKNWLWTGNPLYPLMGSWFGTSSAAAGVTGFTVLEHRLFIYGEHWWEILLTPLLMLVRGEDGNPRRYDGLLSPLLLLILPAIYYARGHKAEKSLLIFSLGYLAFSLVLAGPRVRYLAPILGPTIVLCGLAADRISSRLPVLLSLLFALQLGWAGYYLQRSIQKEKAVETLMGMYSKEEYLRVRIPEYPLIEYANRYLSQSDKLMPILTSNAYYFYRVPLFSGGHFSHAPLLSWIKGAETLQELHLELSERKISYLLLEHARLKALLADALDARQLQLWNEFSRQHLQRVSERGNYSLWKVGAMVAP